MINSSATQKGNFVYYNSWCSNLQRFRAMLLESHIVELLAIRIYLNFLRQNKNEPSIQCWDLIEVNIRHLSECIIVLLTGSWWHWWWYDWNTGWLWKRHSGTSKLKEYAFTFHYFNKMPKWLTMQWNNEDVSKLLRFITTLQMSEHRGMWTNMMITTPLTMLDVGRGRSSCKGPL